ncbi:MAG: DUF4830 domain-containing protein [Ruminococcus sp.]|nr:DUF4830 domain-containing protein [Ruminococcus sp.]MBQ3857026.1 DUF4830 domain-containing protein [Ruminococcus sp.]
MKKRTMLILSGTAALLAGIIFFSPDGKGERPPESPSVSAATVSDRIDYFASHGWEVEEICGKFVTIPTEFSPLYEDYALIQDKQGLPLREYAGRDAQLYVYEVKNYSPDSKKMLAELLVCDDTAIASLVYSEDGGSLKMAVS